MTMTILGISGSLRRESYNRRLLRALAGELPDGVQLSIYDNLGKVPPFSQDAEQPAPPVIVSLRRAIVLADGIVIATPEYNGSLPGQLKNALDWASRPHHGGALERKPVATMSASPSPRGATGAQNDLRRVLERIGADLRGEPITVSHAHDHLVHDEPRLDPMLRTQIRHALTDLLTPATPPAFTLA